LQAGPQVSLTWKDNATNETGFVLERSVNGGAFAQLAAPGPRNGMGSVSYTDTTVTAGNAYAYRVKAVSEAVSSAYSNTASVTIDAVPAAPTILTVTAVRANGNNDTVTVTWTNVANETSYTVQRATNAGFTTGLNTTTGIAANTTSLQQTLKRGTTVWYRVQAVNATGPSAWSNAISVTTP
jgi:predicted phage tail protein